MPSPLSPPDRSCRDETVPEPRLSPPRPSRPGPCAVHRPNDRCRAGPVGRGRVRTPGRSVSFVDRLLTALRAPMFIGLGLAAVYLLQTLPTGLYSGRLAELGVQLFILPTCVAAVICVRRPVLAVMIATIAAGVATVYLRTYHLSEPTLLSPLTPVETVAFLVIIMTVVFHADAVVAVIEVGLLCSSATFALLYRESNNLYSSTFRLNFALCVAVVGVAVMVAIYLRSRD